MRYSAPQKREGIVAALFPRLTNFDLLQYGLFDCFVWSHNLRTTAHDIGEHFRVHRLGGAGVKESVLSSCPWSDSWRRTRWGY